MARFKEFTQEHIQRLEETMSAETRERVDADTLEKAMLYSLEAGGKRFRPMLFLATCSIFQDLNDQDYKLAAAIEMMHTSSLIHDDLPSMDNDDLRRGKPTNHIVFGEAMAILAGDALLNLAYELTAEFSQDAQMVKRLAQLAGVGKQGMVAGQVLDIEGEKAQLTLAELKNIHYKKTGGLIRYCVEAALLSCDVDSDDLLHFADSIGVAFQIRDDILDVTATSQELGKTAGKDQESQKSTYPSILGLDGAQKALLDQVEKAGLALAKAQEIFKSKDFSVLESLLEQFVA